MTESSENEVEVLEKLFCILFNFFPLKKYKK